VDGRDAAASQNLKWGGRGGRTSHAGTSVLGRRAVLRRPPRDGRRERARRPHNLARGGCSVRGANLGASCAARSPTVRTADRAKGRRVLSGTRRPSFLAASTMNRRPYALFVLMIFNARMPPRTGEATRRKFGSGT
jgi:hypothetical protein